jgi:hypothetical protein
MPQVLDFFISDMTYAKFKIEEEDYRKCYHDEAFRNDENLLMQVRDFEQEVEKL